MADAAHPVRVDSPQAWELARLISRLDGHQRALRQRARLGRADQRLMWLLADRGPCTLRGVAEALGLEQSTVNRQVNAALREGLVTRHREPGETAWRYSITDEGLAQFQHDVDLVVHALDEGLEALPESSRRTLLRLLDRFVDAYGAVVHRQDTAEETAAS